MAGNTARTAARCAACVAAGAAAVVSFEPEGLAPLAPLALALLFWVSMSAKGWRGALAYGFAFGVGLFGFGVSWVRFSAGYAGIGPIGGWAVAAAFAGFLALHPAAAMALARGAAGRSRSRLRYIHAAMAWVLAEWVRSWIFTGFPWLITGYSQIPASPLAGYAPVLGIHGVGLATALVAALAVAGAEEFYARIRAAAGVRAGAAFFNRFFNPLFNRFFLAILALAAAGAALKAVPWTTVKGELAVSLLQGNHSQDIKWLPSWRERIIQDYLELAESAQGRLVVMPEAALPVPWGELDPGVRARLAAAAPDGAVLTGIFAAVGNGDEWHNSAVAFGGFGEKWHHKRHLVPFGEYLPFRRVLAPLFARLSIPYSRIRAGDAGRVLRLPFAAVAATVCYEDAFGGELLGRLPEAELLANVTNDAWFDGDGGRMARQHAQISAARALETGRWMVRATNTGVTAAIDHLGERTALERRTRGVLEATVGLRGGATPYVLLGNWPVIAALAVWAAYVVVARRARRGEAAENG